MDLDQRDINERAHAHLPTCSVTVAPRGTCPCYPRRFRAAGPDGKSSHPRISPSSPNWACGALHGATIAGGRIAPIKQSRRNRQPDSGYAVNSAWLHEPFDVSGKLPRCHSGRWWTTGKYPWHPEKCSSYSATIEAPIRRSSISRGTWPRESIRLNTSYTSVFEPALRSVFSSLNHT